MQSTKKLDCGRSTSAGIVAGLHQQAAARCRPSPDVWFRRYAPRDRPG
jgi:hypothetical protein